MKFKPKKILKNVGRSLAEPIYIPKIALLLLLVPLQAIISDSLNLASLGWNRLALSFAICVVILFTAKIYTSRLTAKSSRRSS